MQNFILQSSGFYQLPQELADKTSLYSWQLVLAVVVCLALIAVSKMNSSGIFLQVINGNFKLIGIRTLYKDSLSLSKLPSLLLLFNFVIASSIILFLFSEEQLVSKFSIQLVLISPLILFIWDNIGFGLVSLLSGEGGVLQETRLVRLYGAQLLGIILWVLILTHVLYPSVRFEVEMVMSYFILSEFVLRTLRSILLVYRSGAAWYYIILYFCTLEILPLFVVYSIIVGFS